MIQTIDYQILDWIQATLRTPWLDAIMPRLTMLGNGGILWVVTALILLLRRPTRRWGAVLFFSLTVTLVAGDYIIKPLVARPRPFSGRPEIELLVSAPKNFSFPSGHSIGGVAAATVLMHYRRGLGWCALVMAILIMFSRLYLYVHFPTDVLGGIVIGLVIGFLSIALFERVIFPKLDARKKQAVS